MTFYLSCESLIRDSNINTSHEMGQEFHQRRERVGNSLARTVFNKPDVCNNVFAPEDCIHHPLASGEKCFIKSGEALSPRRYQSLRQPVNQQKLSWAPIIPLSLWKALSYASSHFFPPATL